MKDIKNIELESLSNNEESKRAKEIFTEIVTMIKFMGSFFAKTLLFIYTGSTTAMFKSDYHTLSLIMSTMLVPTYFFERYCFFLGIILTVNDQKAWFEWRREMVRHKMSFHDLLYLMKFIGVEEKRNLIRKNTIRRMSSAVIPKLRGDLNYHVTNIKMDMNEFLSHLQLQVNLELDEVFTSDLRCIIEYFQSLDDFINKTFPNAELEIKIDLMRLILRMTTSTKFVNYIYVLSNMNVEFLNECQIFALFCQVLLVELKKPKQPLKLELSNHPLDNSRGALTHTPRARVRSINLAPVLETMDLLRPSNNLDLSIQLNKATPPSLNNLNISGLHDSIPNTDTRPDDPSQIRSPISERPRPSPFALYKQKSKRQIEDSRKSIRNKEDSLEVDFEQESVSSISRKRLHLENGSKPKQRSSLSPEPKILKRLPQIECMSSVDLITSKASEITESLGEESSEDLEEAQKINLFNK